MSYFIEAIRRLYANGKVDKKKIVEFYEEGKITEQEKLYILDVNLDVQ